MNKIELTSPTRTWAGLGANTWGPSINYQLSQNCLKVTFEYHHTLRKLLDPRTLVRAPITQWISHKVPSVYAHAHSVLDFKEIHDFLGLQPHGLFRCRHRCLCRFRQVPNVPIVAINNEIIKANDEEEMKYQNNSKRVWRAACEKQRRTTATHTHHMNWWLLGFDARPHRTESIMGLLWLSFFLWKWNDPHRTVCFEIESKSERSKWWKRERERKNEKCVAFERL